MRRRAVLLTLGAVALAACGSGGQAAKPASPVTIGNVGALPDYQVDTDPDPTTAPSTTERGDADTTERGDGSATTEATVEATASTIADDRSGARTDGNRLLIIGDSIIAATSSDNGGAMCADLVANGWQVGIDAEEGRHADVGVDVTARRLTEPWDAAVVGLGSNYKNDPAAFASEIGQILDALAPRPVLLVTVSEFEDDRAEVNYVLRESARRYDNVRLLEWSERTRNDESLTGDDGLHLTDRGIAVFVSMIAVAIGDAPGDGRGACLDLPTDDDSPDGDGGDGDGDSSDGPSD